MSTPLAPITLSAEARRYRRQRQLEPIPFLVPGLVLFAIFVLWPLAQGLRVSFYEWSIMPGAEQHFVGWANFRRAFQDPVAWISVKNALLYVIVTVPGQMFFGMLIALGLNQAILARTFWRAVYYLPVLTSWVVVSFIFKYLFNGGGAPINYILKDLLHVLPEYLDWTQNYWTAEVAIISLGIWKGIGWNMVMFLAGLQGIPRELYEAASIDGASRTQSLWRVTLPLMRPVILYVLVLLTIGGFGVFISVVLMTGGGPMNQTQVILSYIYDNGFKYFDFGYGFALATLLSLVILVFNLLQMKIFGRKADY